MFDQEIQNYFEDLIEEVSFQEFEKNEALRSFIRDQFSEVAEN